MDLPGFSALPGFKAPFYGDGQSALNPGTTVFTHLLLSMHKNDPSFESTLFTILFTIQWILD